LIGFVVVTFLISLVVLLLPLPQGIAIIYLLLAMYFFPIIAVPIVLLLIGAFLLFNRRHKEK
jgi:hypothetical protein